MDVIRLSRFKALTDNSNWYGLEKRIIKPSIIINDLKFDNGVFYSNDAPHRGRETNSGFLTIYDLITPVKRFDTLHSSASAPENITNIPYVFIVMAKTNEYGYLRIYTKR